MSSDTRRPSSGRTPVKPSVSSPGGRTPISPPPSGPSGVPSPNLQVPWPDVDTHEIPRPVADRLVSSFKELGRYAAELNDASDALGKSVAAIDASLRTLNLGIQVSVPIGGWERPDGEFLEELVGYDKVNGKWGISIASIRGNRKFPNEAETDVWLFNDAPRLLRINAIDNLPTLLEAMARQAQDVCRRLRVKTQQAQRLANEIAATTAPDQR